ncbi:hypothetical protein ACUVMQ_21310 [Aeromonas veronii]|uniref:hypothetical protein n=1 Tax=Aeromonas veronii TaxID=654 RepID=UPI0040553BCE
MLNNHKKTSLPRTLQVAHWLYEQQRFVCTREAAGILGGSVWSMWQTFSKIRLLSNLLVIDEQKVPSRGGQQWLMRIVHIYPYTLDENQQPHRLFDGTDSLSPLTWNDLLRRSWTQIAQMQAARSEY